MVMLMEDNNDPGNDHNHMDHVNHMQMEEMDMGGMAMAMSFNIQLPFTVLFRPWRVATNGDVAWTCVVLALVAVFYEFIKGVKELVGSFENESKNKWLMTTNEITNETISCIVGVG